MLYAVDAAKHQTTRKENGLRRVPSLLRGLRLLRGRVPRMLRLRDKNKRGPREPRRGPRGQHVGHDFSYCFFIDRAVLLTGAPFRLLCL